MNKHLGIMTKILTAALVVSSIGTISCADVAELVAIPAPGNLMQYVSGETFLPLDFEWLHWKYTDDPASKAKWRDIADWIETTQTVRTAAAIDQLQSAGIPEPKLEKGCYGSDACEWISSAGELAEKLGGWQPFSDALYEARRYVDGYILAVRNEENRLSSETDVPLSGRLTAMIAGEQMLRAGAAMNLAKPALPLSQAGARVFKWMNLQAAFERDRKNTLALKAIVANQHWPKKSEVGAAAAQSAWLIAQHADHDPAFQLSVLREMEPLARSGEAIPSNYALLYDRVMLKLTGAQRYGTQFQCKNGRYELFPLENPELIEKYREVAGLKPLGETAAQLPPKC